jgi:hypothetical protein
MASTTPPGFQQNYSQALNPAILGLQTQNIQMAGVHHMGMSRTPVFTPSHFQQANQHNSFNPYHGVHQNMVLHQLPGHHQAPMMFHQECNNDLQFLKQKMERLTEESMLKDVQLKEMEDEFHQSQKNFEVERADCAVKHQETVELLQTALDDNIATISILENKSQKNEENFDKEVKKSHNLSLVMTKLRAQLNNAKLESHSWQTTASTILTEGVHNLIHDLQFPLLKPNHKKEDDNLEHQHGPMKLGQYFKQAKMNNDMKMGQYYYQAQMTNRIQEEPANRISSSPRKEVLALRPQILPKILPKAGSPILTKNSATVPGTVVSTAPCTMPSTVVSTAPCTMPGTVVSTAPCTVPTTVYRAAPCTVPTTMSRAAPSTVPNTTPCTMPSTVPSTPSNTDQAPLHKSLPKTLATVTIVKETLPKATGNWQGGREAADPKKKLVVSTDKSVTVNAAEAIEDTRRQESPVLECDKQPADGFSDENEDEDEDDEGGSTGKRSIDLDNPPKVDLKRARRSSGSSTFPEDTEWLPAPTKKAMTGNSKDRENRVTRLSQLQNSLKLGPPVNNTDPSDSALEFLNLFTYLSAQIAAYFNDFYAGIRSMLLGKDESEVAYFLMKLANSFIACCKSGLQGLAVAFEMSPAQHMASPFVASHPYPNLSPGSATLAFINSEVIAPHHHINSTNLYCVHNAFHTILHKWHRFVLFSKGLQVFNVHSKAMALGNFNYVHGRNNVIVEKSWLISSQFTALRCLLNDKSRMADFPSQLDEEWLAESVDRADMRLVHPYNSPAWRHDVLALTPCPTDLHRAQVLAHRPGRMFGAAWKTQLHNAQRAAQLY